MADLGLGFIGGGNMANAMIGGLVGKVCQAQGIHVVDVNADMRARLQSTYGVSTSERIDASLEQMDVIVIAVKPQQMREVCEALRPHVKQQLILSIAAGIRASDIARWLGDYQNIVRTMPNTPALIGQGMTGMCALSGVSDIQREQAQAVMRAVGSTMWFDNENLLDPVTALSGSGPAYVFFFLEAMQKAAQELGLTAEQGRELAQATFRGATELATRSDESLATLRERVTSKGGTTYAALTSMQADGVQDAIVRAIHAASKRGHELGEEFGR